MPHSGFWRSSSTYSLVQSPRRTHVDGVVLDLADRADFRQRQEEPDMLGEARVIGSSALAGKQVFRLQHYTVRRQTRTSPCRLRFRTRLQPFQRGTRLSYCINGHVDLGLQQHPTGYVALVGVALAQPLERGLLIVERRQKLEWELRRIERLCGQVGDGYLDLNCVHLFPSLLPWLLAGDAAQIFKQDKQVQRIGR